MLHWYSSLFNYSKNVLHWIRYDELRSASAFLSFPFLLFYRRWNVYKSVKENRNCFQMQIRKLRIVPGVRFIYRILFIFQLQVYWCMFSDWMKDRHVLWVTCSNTIVAKNVGCLMTIFPISSPKWARQEQLHTTQCIRMQNMQHQSLYTHPCTHTHTRTLTQQHTSTRHTHKSRHHSILHVLVTGSAANAKLTMCIILKSHFVGHVAFTLRANRIVWCVLSIGLAFIWIQIKLSEYILSISPFICIATWSNRLESFASQ